MNPKIVQPSLHPQGIGASTYAANATGQQISVPTNCDIKVSVRHKEDFGKFQAISPLRASELEKPDLFDILASLSRPSFRVFNQLKLERNRKNSLCHYPIGKLSNSQREVFNRGVRQLIDKQVVKRVPVSNNIITVRKNTYMINPVMIKCQEYQDACKTWIQL